METVKLDSDTMREYFSIIDDHPMGGGLTYIPAEHHTLEVCEHAVRVNPRSLIYFMKDHPELIRKTISKHYKELTYIYDARLPELKGYFLENIEWQKLYIAENPNYIRYVEFQNYDNIKIAFTGNSTTLMRELQNIVDISIIDADMLIAILDTLNTSSELFFDPWYDDRDKCVVWQRHFIKLLKESDNVDRLNLNVLTLSMFMCDGNEESMFIVKQNVLRNPLILSQLDDSDVQSLDLVDYKKDVISKYKSFDTLKILLEILKDSDEPACSDVCSDDIGIRLYDAVKGVSGIELDWLVEMVPALLSRMENVTANMMLYHNPISGYHYQHYNKMSNSEMLKYVKYAKLHGFAGDMKHVFSNTEITIKMLHKNPVLIRNIDNPTYEQRKLVINICPLCAEYYNISL